MKRLHIGEGCVSEKVTVGEGYIYEKVTYRGGLHIGKGYI